MRLFGNDIDETTSVLEADLEWILSWTKGDFIGRAALERQKAAGRPRGWLASRWWTGRSRVTAIRS